MLIAEKDPDILKALIGALQDHYITEAVKTAEDARKAIYGGGYFLAFIGDGVEKFGPADALDAVKKSGVQTRIIAVFAGPDPLREAGLLDLGAEATLTFPFPPRLARAYTGRAKENVDHQIRVSRLLGRLSALYLIIMGFDCPGMGDTGAIETVAKNDEPFLLIGERGAGKELLARAIHFAGRRALRPFEVVNARRIPPVELGGALFGAGEELGAVERAGGGSLLIHGIGEVPLSLQKRLLEIINPDVIGADARLMFTTRIDLHGAALRGEFSPALWAALEANSFNVPSLRERPQAIPILAKRLLDQYCERLGSPARDIHSSARDLLASHSWPGNLLELEKIIALGAARASGPLLVAEDLIEIQPRRDSISMDQLSLEDVVAHKLRPLVSTVDALTDANLYELVISRVERPLLSLVLEKVGGNQIKAAHALGLHRNTLRKKLTKLGIIPKSRDRP